MLLNINQLNFTSCTHWLNVQEWSDDGGVRVRSWLWDYEVTLVIALFGQIK